MKQNEKAASASGGSSVGAKAKVSDIDPNEKLIVNGVEHKLKDYMGQFKDVIAEENAGEPVTYSFSSGTHTGGIMQSIMISLYKRAKKIHVQFQRDKELANQ